MPAAGPDPENAAVSAETRRQVMTALAGLPDRYRTAVRLKDGSGCPPKAWPRPWESPAAMIGAAMQAPLSGLALVLELTSAALG